MPVRRVRKAGGRRIRKSVAKPAPRPTAPTPRAHDSAAATALATQICAVTDPFCGHAVGARWNRPGVAEPPTYTATRRFIVPVTTGDTGTAVLVVAPSYGRYVYHTEGLNTTNAFTGFGPSDLDGGDTGIYDAGDGGQGTLARVTNAGVRWWDTAPATGTGGTVICHDVADLTDLEADNLTTSDVYTVYESMLLDRRKPAAWVSRRVGGTQSAEFKEPGSTGGRFGAASGFSGLLLYVTGPASTTVLNVEIVLHLEIMQRRDKNFSTPDRSRRVSHAAAEGAVVIQSAKPSLLQGELDRVSGELKRRAIAYAKHQAAGMARGSIPLVGGILGDFIDNL